MHMCLGLNIVYLMLVKVVFDTKEQTSMNGLISRQWDFNGITDRNRRVPNLNFESG